MNLQTKKANMEKFLSSVFGQEIEVTIRGNAQFTFSFQGNKITNDVINWLGIFVESKEALYDAELDETFIYFTAKHI